MFQNIERGFNRQENQKKDVRLFRIAELKELGMKFFTKQNILLYIVTVMISMVSFGGSSALGLAPFALSIVALSIPPYPKCNTKKSILFIFLFSFIPFFIMSILVFNIIISMTKNIEKLV